MERTKTTNQYPGIQHSRRGTTADIAFSHATTSPPAPASSPLPPTVLQPLKPPIVPPGQVTKNPSGDSILDVPPPSPSPQITQYASHILSIEVTSHEKSDKGTGSNSETEFQPSLESGERSDESQNTKNNDEP
ncbi:hypothetical protein Fot_37344 [Forsythia ovata]|uniref:Uncharacterized protein n=1 Tax=Forsythia ovata TaxID=205694 RepID=A0ABD1RYQ6_9LAMI